MKLHPFDLKIKSLSSGLVNDIGYKVMNCNEKNNTFLRKFFKKICL